MRGSIEAIRKELGKLTHPEVQIKILQATVGGVSEADVYLADASDAVIIAFNVVPDERACAMAEDRNVQIRRYDIIYKVTDDLKASLEGMLKPEKREVELGRAWCTHLQHQPRRHDRRLPCAGRHNRAERSRPRNPRKPHRRRIPAGIAETREG